MSKSELSPKHFQFLTVCNLIISSLNSELAKDESLKKRVIEKANKIIDEMGLNEVEFIQDFKITRVYLDASLE